MPAGGEQVDPHTLRINAVFSISLYCIRMKNDLRIVSFDHLHRFLDRLYRSHFVVDIHHRNQDRILTQRFFQCVKPDSSRRVNRKICDTESLFLLQMTHRIQNSRMFDRGSDQMISSPFICPRHTDQSQIIAFRTAGRKKDFFRIDFQTFCDRFFCVFYIMLRLHAFPVHRRRVPIIPAHHFIHKLTDFRICPRCRRVI